MNRELCLIFDLDGTLVDSESLSNRVLLELVPKLGGSLQSLPDRYRGQKLARILADIELGSIQAVKSPSGS